MVLFPWLFFFLSSQVYCLDLKIGMDANM